VLVRGEDQFRASRPVAWMGRWQTKAVSGQLNLNRAHVPGEAVADTG
jgi:hypothetical protein